jgi:hypothetical protein
MWIMCSIRNRRAWTTALIALGAAAAAITAPGCQTVPPPHTEKLNTTPVIVDDAMQRRQWESKTGWYANGATVAGPTGYWFQTSDELPEGYRRVVDPMVATMNIGLLPVTTVVEPPWKVKVYHGAITPPTYNAMPPLAPIR